MGKATEQETDKPATRDPRPVVRMPQQGVPGFVIAGVAVVMAIGLFVTLDGRRQQSAAVTPPARSDGFMPPPPLVLPTEAVRAPLLYPSAPGFAAPVAPSPLPAAPAFVPPPTFTPQTPFLEPPAPSSVAAPADTPAPRADSQAMVFDQGATQTDGAGGASATPSPSGGARADGAGLDDAPAQASAMRNRTDTVPIGTLIPIVLETPVDTARPGLVRAVASRDTRGFDGRRILIPRGSRLIGEYKADVRSGQDRVLVNWIRVIRPDGVTIRLGSPAADQLGGSGVPGRVNSFFLQRFANAILQSALTVGVNLASRPRSGSIIVGIPTGQIANVGQSLIPNDYQPKITVKQGAQLNVFVARDLDFSTLTGG